MLLRRFRPGNAVRQCREAMPGLLPDIALKHDEMFLIVGAQLDEALRQAGQSANVIFYWGGL
jgi:hypothetical protein